MWGLLRVLAVVSALGTSTAACAVDPSPHAVAGTAASLPPATPPPTTSAHDPSPPTTSTTSTISTTSVVTTGVTTTEPPAASTTVADAASTTVSGATTTAGPVAPVVDPAFPASSQALDWLAAGNLAASVSVWRDGSPVLQRASGSRRDGQPMTTDTPMVIASVSKLVTALTVSRLVQAGVLSVDQRVPWSELGIAHDPAWDDVTVGELLAHTSGMPVNRPSWLDLPGSCAVPLAEALAAPPRPNRGTWRYSNGNYCALGLLIEHATGEPIDAAARRWVLDPAGVSGPHLTTDGQLSTDGPYPMGVARFDRLGGAGTWMASTDDMAAMLAAVTEADLAVLTWPGIIVDQYGWGHTGTVDGAKACAWVMEGGRTIVAAVIAGNRQSTGGAVCDVVIPMVAADLGIWADVPVRSPA